MAALFTTIGSFFSSSLESFYNQIVGKKHEFLEYGVEKVKEFEELLTNLAVDSYIELMQHAKEDVDLGKVLVEVHPLTNLEIIVLREDFLEKVHYINKMEGPGFSYLKDKFFAGYEISLQERFERDEIYQYLDNFSSKVNVPREMLEPLVDKNNWKEFISIVLNL